MPSYSTVLPNGQEFNFDHPEQLSDDIVRELAADHYVNTVLPQEQPVEAAPVIQEDIIQQPVAEQPVEPATIGENIAGGFHQYAGLSARGLGEYLDSEWLKTLGEETLAKVPKQMGTKDVKDIGDAAQLVKQETSKLAGGMPVILSEAYLGAKLGARLTPGMWKPFGALVGSILLPSTMNMGEIAQRREEENQMRVANGMEPIEYSKTAGAGYALGAASLERLGLGVLGKYVPGLNKLLGAQGKEASESMIKGIASGSYAKEIAKGAGVGVVAEVPTEVAQTIIERQAAGLDLFSPEAYDEYREIAILTAAGAGPLGGVAGAGKRFAGQTIQDQEAADLRVEQEQAAEQARVAAAEQAAADEEAAAQQAELEQTGFIFGSEGVNATLAQTEGVKSTVQFLEEDDQAVSSEIQDSAAKIQQLTNAIPTIQDAEQAENVISERDFHVVRNVLAQAAAHRRQAKKLQLQARSLTGKARSKLLSQANSLNSAASKLENKARGYAKTNKNEQFAQASSDLVATAEVPLSERANLDYKDSAAIELDTLDITTEAGQQRAREIIISAAEKAKTGATADEYLNSPLAQELGIDPETALLEPELEEVDVEEEGVYELPEIVPDDVRPGTPVDESELDLQADEQGVELAGEQQPIPPGGVSTSDEGALADDNGPAGGDLGTEGGEQPALKGDEILKGFSEIGKGMTAGLTKGFFEGYSKGTGAMRDHQYVKVAKQIEQYRGFPFDEAELEDFIREVDSAPDVAARKDIANKYVAKKVSLATDKKPDMARAQGPFTDEQDRIQQEDAALQQRERQIADLAKGLDSQEAKALYLEVQEIIKANEDLDSRERGLLKQDYLKSVEDDLGKDYAEYAFQVFNYNTYKDSIYKRRAEAKRVSEIPEPKKVPGQKVNPDYVKSLMNMSATALKTEGRRFNISFPDRKTTGMDSAEYLDFVREKVKTAVEAREVITQYETEQDLQDAVDRGDISKKDLARYANLTKPAREKGSELLTGEHIPALARRYGLKGKKDTEAMFEPPKDGKQVYPIEETMGRVRQTNMGLRMAQQKGDMDTALRMLANSQNRLIREVAYRSRELGIRLVPSTKESDAQMARDVGNTAVGSYHGRRNEVSIRSDHVGDEHVMAHELVHAQTRMVYEAVMGKDDAKLAQLGVKDAERAKKAVNQLLQLYNELIRKTDVTGVYGFASAKEMLSEALSNPEFQTKLQQTTVKAGFPTPKDAWSAFVKLISDLLGYKNNDAFKSVLDIWDTLSDITDEYAIKGGEVAYASKREPKQIEPARKAPEVNQSNEQAVEDVINNSGGKMPTKKPSAATESLEKLRNVKLNRKPKELAEIGVTWSDRVATQIFSKSAAAYNVARRRMRFMSRTEAQNLGAMLDMSDSQALHSQAIASRFLQEGNMVYDEGIHKYRVVSDENTFKNLAVKLGEIANQYNVSSDKLHAAAHQYLVAKRILALRNNVIEQQNKIERLKLVTGNKKEMDAAKALRKDLESRVEELTVVSEMDDAQIEAALALETKFPEIGDVTKIWDGIRTNAVNVLVDSGSMDAARAERWLDAAGYIPFQRTEQIEAGRGFKSNISSLIVNPQTNKRLRGADSEINDVFQNMQRMTEFYVESAVRNKSAQKMIDVMTELGMAEKRANVGSAEANKRVTIYRDGKQEIYVVEDPAMVDAFAGIESAGVPAVKFLTSFTDLLRKSVVLNPLFSLGQLSQDAVGAMFASGLSMRQAVKLPVYVIKEFVGTVSRNSKAHERLKNVGVVGVSDYNAAEIKQTMQDYVDGLDENSKGWGRKAMSALERFSMASDNAVRQAVYELSIQEGLSEAEAIERSFEIINFRRRGSNPMVSVMVRYIPFFNAYLQALNVQGKTMLGEGISPRNEKEFKKFAQILGMATFMSVLYALMKSDDEDYEKMDANTRHRMLHIAGDFGLPLRTDLFLLPKVLAEGTVNMFLSETQDASTFKAAIASAIGHGLLSPTAVPQFLKPAAELYMNYNFYTERPVVPDYMRDGLEPYLQYTDSTSEISKQLGEMLNVSPIQLDHLIRGMFGSAGGAVLFGSNLVGMGYGLRPETRFGDTVAQIPGMSRFMNKEDGNAIKDMYYKAREQSNRAYKSYNEMIAKAPNELDAYVADPDIENRIAYYSVFTDIDSQLGEIRKMKKYISADRDMSNQEKGDLLEEYKQMEKELLQSLELKKLRKELGM